MKRFTYRLYKKAKNGDYKKSIKATVYILLETPGYWTQKECGQTCEKCDVHCSKFHTVYITNYEVREIILGSEEEVKKITFEYGKTAFPSKKKAENAIATKKQAYLLL